MSTEIVFVSGPNNETMVSSREVAAKFKKRHTDVLRTLEKQVIPFLSEQFSRRNFALATYVDEQEKPRQEYRMTRDGFSILAMGFTGQEAMAWKERFINAFNELIGDAIALKLELVALHQKLFEAEKILAAIAARAKRPKKELVLRVPIEIPVLPGFPPHTELRIVKPLLADDPVRGIAEIWFHEKQIEGLKAKITAIQARMQGAAC
jgi:Rha family phage regulatory protein